jgi:chromosome segregation ATPase
MPKKKTKQPLAPNSSEQSGIQLSDTLSQVTETNRIDIGSENHSDDFQITIQNLKTEITNIQQEKDKLQEQIQSFLKQKLQTEQLISNVNEEKHKLELLVQQNINKLQLKDKEVIQLQALIDKKNVIIEESRSKIDALNKQVDNWKDEYIEAKEALNQKITELVELKHISENKIKHIELELNEKLKTINELIIQSSEYKRKLERIKSKCSML